MATPDVGVPPAGVDRRRALIALSVPGVAAADQSQAVDSPVRAEDGWTPDNVWYDEGQTFHVSTDYRGPDGKAGTRTVGYPGLPFVGPYGYDSATDHTIYQGCKIVDSLPYGHLLGQFRDNAGNPVGPIFAVGGGGSFRAVASGSLTMHINDQDRCLGDNRGYVEVTFT